MVFLKKGLAMNKLEKINEHFEISGSTVVCKTYATYIQALEYAARHGIKLETSARYPVLPISVTFPREVDARDAMFFTALAVSP